MRVKAKKPQRRKLAKKAAFLKAFIICADLTRAAAAIKCDRSEHYRWLKRDPKYAKAFEAACEQAGQTLEDDAVHWARIGVFEQYTYQGRPQFAQRVRILGKLLDGREIFLDEYKPAELRAFEVQSQRAIEEDDPRRPLGAFRRSEGLMGKLLKAFKPERYAERGSMELTGRGGEAIEISIVDRLNAARNRLAAAKHASEQK